MIYWVATYIRLVYINRKFSDRFKRRKRELELEESEKWFYTKNLIERRSIKDIERKVDNIDTEKEMKNCCYSLAKRLRFHTFDISITSLLRLQVPPKTWGYS